MYAQSYGLLFFTVSNIMNWVQKIKCYDFKTVSPHKSWYRTVCTVIIFNTFPASARSHPTDHYGQPTLSENIQRNKYSYKIQELDVYRANQAAFLKKCALINFARCKREIHPQKRALLKKRILVCLAMSIGIKADTYEVIEPPVRAEGISLESMTDMFSK